jgi:hypothetical protein
MLHPGGREMCRRSYLDDFTFFYVQEVGRRPGSFLKTDDFISNMRPVRIYTLGSHVMLIGICHMHTLDTPIGPSSRTDVRNNRPLLLTPTGIKISGATDNVVGDYA